MNNFIPVNEPLLGSREKELLNECIDSGWISSEGPFVSEFEEKLSKYVGRKYGISCSNGSAALDLALAALKIGPGDEVILPSFTIISCAASIVRLGATPVVVDVHPDTWNIDIEQVAAAVTSSTVAIMVVHIYGLPVDIDPILAIANKFSLAVIEDSAELIGGTYKGKQCGSFGTISTFSFYPNKHITTGEGGMVLTDDPILAERCKSLRNLCFDNKKRFVHYELGWNYRLTNLQAALGLAQLEKLGDSLIKKRYIGKQYLNHLSPFLPVSFQPDSLDYADNLYWVFAILLHDTCSFDSFSVREALGKANIGSRPFFFPIHKQPVFLQQGLFANDHHPVSENLYKLGFYVPSGLSISLDQIKYVSEMLNSILSIA